MKTIKKRANQNNKQGSLLITVLGLFVVFIVLFGALSTMSLRTTTITIKDVEREQAYLYAKSVLQSLVADVAKNNLTADDLVALNNKKVTITSASGTKEVDIQVTKTTDEVSVTSTANVNDQSSSLNAKYSIKKSGFDDEINVDPRLFRSAIYETIGTNDRVLILRSVNVVGDIISSNQTVIQGKVKINGSLDTEYFRAFESDSDGNSVQINGNVYIRKTAISGTPNNLYINGDYVSTLTSMDSFIMTNSVVTGNIYIRSPSLQLNRVIIGKSLVQFGSYSSLLLYNTVIYNDAYLENGYVKEMNFGDYTSFVGGKASVKIGEWATTKIYKQALKNMNGIYGPFSASINRFCEGTCGTTLITPDNTMSYALPTYPDRGDLLDINQTLAKVKENVGASDYYDLVVECDHPNSTTKNCKFKDKNNLTSTSLPVIDATGGPVYVNVTGLNNFKISDSNVLYFSFDPTDYVIGNGSVYFVFDENLDGKRVIITNKIGYNGNAIDSNTNKFFFFTRKVNYVELKDDFNGYIYTNGQLGISSKNFRGSMQSNHIMFCADSHSDYDCGQWSTKSTITNVTFIDPSTGGSGGGGGSDDEHNPGSSTTLAFDGYN